MSGLWVRRYTTSAHSTATLVAGGFETQVLTQRKSEVERSDSPYGCCIPRPPRHSGACPAVFGHENSRMN